MTTKGKTCEDHQRYRKCGDWERKCLRSKGFLYFYSKMSHFTTLRAKRATFEFLRFFQPFWPFKNYFRPLKLCLYSKLCNKITQLKRFTMFKKGQKRVCKAQKKNSCFLNLILNIWRFLEYPKPNFYKRRYIENIQLRRKKALEGRELSVFPCSFSWV